LGDNNSGFFGAFSWDDPEASVSEVLRRLNTHLGRMDDVRGQFAGVVAQLSTAPRVELLIPENIDALSLDATSGPTLGGQPSSGPAILVRSRATGWQDDVSSAGSSASGVQRTMREHHDAVQARAREFCSSLDIPDDLTAVVVEAAVHHDLGKADPRFQSMLRGGTPAPQDPRQEVLLAKSGMSSLDRSAFRRAARLSGCPAGFRHEAFSALAVAAVVDRGPMDRLHRDLLVHLVASHHGRSRPLLPPVIDDAAEAYEVQVDGQAVSVKSIDGIDWDGPGRFERLNRHFGVWGLALLETIVRLADISCSEEGR
jgi:CRISPR-associated endonuclease/helicase Cas3